MSPPMATITPSAPESGTSTSAVIEYDLFLVLMTAHSRSRLPLKISWRLPWINSGRPAIWALPRSAKRSSSGITLYLAASISHSRCSSASLSGLLLGEVVGLRPVRVGVVQLPDVVVEGGHDRVVTGGPGRAVLGDRGPALVVDAAVAEHLEVLRLVPLGGRRRR